jgi:hypothetical protein
MEISPPNRVSASGVEALCVFKKGRLMHVSKNMIAAITGAIDMFLDAERQVPRPVFEETRVRDVSSPAYSLWAVMGRQSTMDMRRFLQMRLAR